MANYILFGIYLFVVLGIFGFVAIFIVHIRDYQHYSGYLAILMRIYIVIMILITIIGGYHILTGTIFPSKQNTIQRINL